MTGSPLSDPAAGADDRPFLDLASALRRSLGDLSGAAAVDLGCGGGGVTRLLAGLGAEMTGIEPNAAAIASATAVSGPDIRYLCAGAEATALPTGAFDLALFSRSLHHIPDAEAALREAARLVRPGGRIAVLEPEAPDPCTPLMRLIDDETAAYARAQAAIERAIAGGLATRQSTLFFATKYRAPTPQAVIDHMLSVDPARRFDEADRLAFDAAFAAARQEDADGVFIPTWERLDVLACV